MANIILTVIDSKHGVINCSYSFSDADIDKLYVAYKHYLTPIENDPNKDEIVINSKDIVEHIYGELMSRVVDFVLAEHIKIVCERENIQPIKAITKL